MVFRSLLATPVCALLLVLACLGNLPAGAQMPGSTVREVVTTPHVRAELMAHAPDGVAPGAPVWVGLQLAHQPEWHTYWKNAGDSGLPTTLGWTLPPGVEAGDISWPLPRKIPIGSLANYGYEGTVLLPVPLTITPDFKMPLLASATSEMEIKLHASWLVCRKECIPEEGEFALKLPLKGSTAFNGPAFAAAQAAQPHALAGESRIQVDGNSLQVSVRGLPAAVQGKTLGFFPETPEVIHTAAVSGTGWTQQWAGGEWQARIPLAEHRSNSPDAMPFVLTLADADRQAEPPWGWRTEAPVQGTWPATATPAAVSPALQAALASNAAATPAPAPTAAPLPTLALALLGALLGGLLLNLMPCVFPVLAIKVLGFTQHHPDAQGQRRACGWAYTAGVVLSFLLLGGLMLGLRAAGTQLGWGFQLQSPAVVAGLALLFTLIGLNLAGVFEVGQMVPSSVASLRARNPVANDFLSGVLAVVVASPCTAPFMGASLGLAIGLPAWQALALFGALGIGLALPYLAASLFPAVARLLPRPGPWMDTLRRLLAFPMFATVAWLVWVLGQQSGIDGAGALLALLVAVSAVAWALGLRGRSRLVLAPATAAIAAVLLVTWGPAIVQPQAAAPVGRAATALWQPWSADKVQALGAQGQPVFVDFTAAWCVTCQVNKKTTLSNAEVLADFQARNVALLRADWTRQDPAITQALTSLGRSGVPVYVLYRLQQAPLVMTEILSPAEVRAALATL